MDPHSPSPPPRLRRSPKSDALNELSDSRAIIRDGIDSNEGNSSIRLVSAEDAKIYATSPFPATEAQFFRPRSERPIEHDNEIPRPDGVQDVERGDDDANDNHNANPTHAALTTSSSSSSSANALSIAQHRPDQSPRPRPTRRSLPIERGAAPAPASAANPSSYYGVGSVSGGDQSPANLAFGGNVKRRPSATSSGGSSAKASPTSSSSNSSRAAKKLRPARPAPPPPHLSTIRTVRSSTPASYASSSYIATPPSRPTDSRGHRNGRRGHHHHHRRRSSSGNRQRELLRDAERRAASSNTASGIYSTPPAATPPPPALPPRSAARLSYYTPLSSSILSSEGTPASAPSAGSGGSVIRNPNFDGRTPAGYYANFPPGVRRSLATSSSVNTPGSEQRPTPPTSAPRPPQQEGGVSPQSPEWAYSPASPLSPTSPVSQIGSDDDDAEYFAQRQHQLQQQRQLYAIDAPAHSEVALAQQQEGETPPPQQQPILTEQGLLIYPDAEDPQLITNRSFGRNARGRYVSAMSTIHSVSTGEAGSTHRFSQNGSGFVQPSGGSSVYSRDPASRRVSARASVRESMTQEAWAAMRESQRQGNSWYVPTSQPDQQQQQAQSQQAPLEFDPRRGPLQQNPANLGVPPVPPLPATSGPSSSAAPQQQQPQPQSQTSSPIKQKSSPWRRNILSRDSSKDANRLSGISAFKDSIPAWAREYYAHEARNRATIGALRSPSAADSRPSTPQWQTSPSRRHTTDLAVYESQQSPSRRSFFASRTRDRAIRDRLMNPPEHPSLEITPLYDVPSYIHPLNANPPSANTSLQRTHEQQTREQQMPAPLQATQAQLEGRQSRFPLSSPDTDASSSLRRPSPPEQPTHHPANFPPTHAPRRKPVPSQEYRSSRLEAFNQSERLAYASNTLRQVPPSSEGSNSQQVPSRGRTRTQQTFSQDLALLEPHRESAYRRSDWSPHLWYAPTTAPNRRSAWIAPSLDEREEGFFRPGWRNAQLWLFLAGFVLPFLWWVGAVMPLPQLDMHKDTEQGRKWYGSEKSKGKGKEKLAEEKIYHGGDAAGQRAIQTTRESLEGNGGVRGDWEPQLRATWQRELEDGDRVALALRRFENARWWRRVNRGMSVLGALVIVAVIAIAVVTVKGKGLASN